MKKGDNMTAARIASFAIAALVFLPGAGPAFARGAVEGPVIYVENQDLFYDSIVTAMELPQHGPFQQLYPCDFGLCTEFGPGDPGHRGGRWWIDENGNGERDAEDTYFLCPLLGPGRDGP
jgi:hypothetical protein